jgi:glutamyl-tRNA synthetase
MSADEVYEQSLEWAKNNDEALAKALESDADYAKSIFAIGRGGKKPRKDLTTWADVKPYVDLFYDELFEIKDTYPEQFDKADIKKALESFVAGYDANDDMNAWFDKIKAIADSLGFASDMKAYKADPAAFKGNVADVSMFIRVALTGKFNAPDMYTVMQILGYDRVCERIKNMIASL